MEKTPLKINKEVKTLKLNVTNIRSILIQENKRNEKLKKEKKSDEKKKKSFEKLKNNEKILENAKKIPVVGQVGSNIKKTGQNIIDKILNFGGLILSGILVNNLPKIIETVRGIIDSIVNFLTPIQSGFNLLKGIFIGEIDKTKYDADKKRFDDSLSQLSKDGGLIDQIAEQAGPLGGLIKFLKPAIELFRNVAGGKDKVLAVKDGQEGVKNNTTGEFTPRQFTQAERDRYTGAGGRGAGAGGRGAGDGGGPVDAPDLKTAIRQLESGNDYGSMYSRDRADFSRGKEDITKMTIDEVDQLQTDYLNHQASKGYGERQRSAAMGAYQMIEVKKVAKNMGLDTSKVLFNKETQDLMSNSWLNGAGYQEWKKGEISDAKFNDNLAGEFASIKKTSGVGAYDNDGMNNAYGNIMPLLKRLKKEASDPKPDSTPDPPDGGPLTLDPSEIPGENATAEEMAEYERKLAEIAKRQAELWMLDPIKILKEKEASPPLSEKQQRNLFENWIDNSNKRSKKDKELSTINQPIDGEEEGTEVLVTFQRIYNTKTIPFPTYIPV